MPGAGAPASGQAVPTVRKAWPGGVTQAVAQAGNHTCIELSSARSTWTRFEPMSAVMSTSFSSS
eukprot:scaffold9843_cov140-Isochrysis_galbana.AAC.1